MADIANVVLAFLDLATTWYKLAAAHNTASATLKHHLKNFAQYHSQILEPIEALFRLNRRLTQDPLVVLQAARVVHLDLNLREWLDDAGFRSVKQEVKVIVARRSHQSAYAREYFVERRRSHQGQLRLPRFGVTSKETAFIALFDRLREAYEKLEAVYPGDVYRSIRRTPVPRIYRDTTYRPTGNRGGFNSDIDSEAGSPPLSVNRDSPEGIYSEPFRQSMPPIMTAEPFYGDFDQFPQRPFRLTKRQKLRQELMLQDLSERLERNIANMMISNGDEQALRERRHRRGPLEDAHRDVLHEKVIREKVAENQQLERETRKEASKLRKVRESNLRNTSTNIDELETDLEDEAVNVIFEDLPPPPPPSHHRIIIEPDPHLSDGLRGPYKQGPQTMPPVPGLYSQEPVVHGDDFWGVHLDNRGPRPAHVSSYNSQASEHQGQNVPTDFIVEQGASRPQQLPRTPTEAQSLEAEQKRLAEERRRMTAERELYQQERHLLHQQRQTIETERMQLAAEMDRFREEAQRHEQQRQQSRRHDHDRRHEEASERRERESTVRRRHSSPHRQRGMSYVYHADSQSRRSEFEPKRKSQGDSHQRESRSRPIRFSLVRPSVKR